MDLFSIFAPLLSIAFLVERVLEAAFDIVELSPNIAAMKKSEDPAVKARWSKFKQIASVIIGILIGMFVANALGMTFFAQFDTLAEVDPETDRLIAGAAAGALAPYVHQVLELLLKLQKFFETQKEKIESDMEAPIPTDLPLS